MVNIIVMCTIHCTGVLEIDYGNVFLTVSDIIPNRHILLLHSLERNLFV